MSTDVNVNVDPVSVNINGLDDIDADITANVSADLDADLSADLDATLDVGLDNINARLHVDELQADVRARLTLDEIKAEVKADLQASIKELAPIFFHFFWDSIPLVKVGFPHRYRLGFILCGKEFFAVTFCGESEIISEKNPCPQPPGGCNDC